MLSLLVACAANAVEVWGRVQTVQGEPRSADVTLIGPRGLILAETVADEDGHFSVLVAELPERIAVHAASEDLDGVSYACPLGVRLPSVFLGDGSSVLVEGLLLDGEGQPATLQEVQLLRGWNGTGPVVDRVGTDGQGLFSIQLEAGAWTARAGKARFPVLAGGPAPVGIFAEVYEDELLVASAAPGLHLTGPVAADPSGFHVWAEEPIHPVQGEPQVSWSGQDGMEVIRVANRRPGVYRAGVWEAPPGTVVQVISEDGGFFDQATLDSEGAWTALVLDEAVRQAQEYSILVNPADGEAW